MSDKIELDLDAIEALASKATPGPWWIDSHGHCMVSQANGGHEPVFQAMDLVKPAVRHPETGNLSHWPNDWDASFIAAANPAIVLELVRRLRAAEESIKVGPDDFLVVRAESPEQAHDVLRQLVRMGTMRGVVMPRDFDIEALDEEGMRQAGWVREPQWQPMSEAPPFPFTGDIVAYGRVIQSAAWCSRYWQDSRGRSIPAGDVTHWRHRMPDPVLPTT